MKFYAKLVEKKGVGGNENERNEQNAVKNENDKTVNEMQLKTKRRKQ